MKIKIKYVNVSCQLRGLKKIVYFVYPFVRFTLYDSALRLPSIPKIFPEDYLGLVSDADTEINSIVLKTRIEK